VISTSNVGLAFDTMNAGSYLQNAMTLDNAGNLTLQVPSLRLMVLILAPLRELRRTPTPLLWVWAASSNSHRHHPEAVGGTLLNSAGALTATAPSSITSNADASVALIVQGNSATQSADLADFYLNNGGTLVLQIKKTVCELRHSLCHRGTTVIDSSRTWSMSAPSVLALVPAPSAV